MASARARLGKARRGIVKRERQGRMFSNILSDVGAVATFAAGQAKKADTAWEEYEAGYKEIGGDAAKIPERPKIGKGYFKGPQGDVQIGGSLYDRSKIQKAGSFLGSNASAILGEGARTEYLQRTAPGRDLTTKDIPKFGTSQEINQLIQQPSFASFSHDSAHATPSVSGVMPQEQFPTQDYKQTTSSQGMGKGWLESLQPKQTMGSGSPRGFSFAHGGDFITNGPQEILVGDNPSGRERVTIKPLPPKNNEEYKKRNLLESLYENNKLRKKY